MAYCRDEELVSISFNSETEVMDHINLLEAKGLTYLEDGQAVDMCLMEQLRGPLNKASWAEYGHITLDKGITQAVKACRLTGSTTRAVMLPERWKYRGSFSELFFNCGVLSYNDDDALKTACDVVARGYNRMNPGFIAPLLAKDPVFSSQIDHIKLRGHNEVFRYFVGKFASLRCGKPRNYMELATYRGEPCLVASEGSKDNPVAVLRIGMSEGFVKQIHIGTKPHYSECERLGIYPGLVEQSEGREDQPREHDHQSKDRKKPQKTFKECTATAAGASKRKPGSQ